MVDKKILIKNGKIITMSKQGIIESGQILISEKKIISVGQNIKIDSDVQIIDAKGKYVLPGFIDAHSHIGIFELGGQTGVDGNETSNPITPHLRGLDGINYRDLEFSNAALSGITTVATGPGSANPIAGQFVTMKTHGKTYDEMIIQSYNSQKMSFGENPKNIYGKSGKMPVTRMGSVALIREWLYKASEYSYKEQKALKDGIRFDGFDLKLAALSKVINREVLVKAHAHRADDILAALRIAKEFDLKMTLDHCTEGYLIADEIVRSNVGVILGPMTVFPDKQEMINACIESPGIMAKAGAKIAVMTDLPATPTNVLPSIIGICMKGGLKEEDAFRSITINAAELLGLEDKLGSLEEGKDADIILYDGHPFKDATSKCTMTMINGVEVK